MSYHAKRFFPPRYFAKRYWSTGEAVPGQVALSGLRATLAQGALAPEVAGDKSVVLVGLSVAASYGLVDKEVDKALLGLSITTAQGALGIDLSGSRTVELTGVGGTAAGGLLLPALDLALSGQSASALYGTLIGGRASDLTGQAGTGSGGALGVEEAVPLLGLSAAALRGHIGSDAELVVPLTGYAATVTGGDVVGGKAVDIGGQYATATGGDLVAEIAWVLAGLRLLTARGYLKFFSTNEYHLYVRTFLSETAVKTSSNVLFVVQDPELEEAAQEEQDDVIQRTQVELVCELDPVNAWVLKDTQELVVFTEPVELYIETTPSTVSVMPDATNQFVRTHTEELLAA